MCANAHYHPNDIRLYCKQTDNICVYQYYCPQVKKYKLNNREGGCIMYNKEKKTLNKNQYNVRFEKRGILFVEIDNYVQEFKNPYDYIPESVELARVNGEWFIKGFEPKIKEKSKKEVVEDGIRITDNDLS